MKTFYNGLECYQPQEEQPQEENKVHKKEQYIPKTTKKSFMFFHDWKYDIEILEPDQVKTLILNLIDLSESINQDYEPNNYPIISENTTKIVYRNMSRTIQENNKKWVQACEKNKRNISTRYEK